MKKPTGKDQINTPPASKVEPASNTLLAPVPKHRPEVDMAESHRPQPLRKFWKRHKKGIITGSLAGLAVLTIGGVYLVRAMNKPEPLAVVAPATSSPTPEPTLTTKPSRLTGVFVDPDKADLPIMASIVENLGGTGGARPQSGLSSAGVVYEALAEGGITRYLALWQSDIPADIGPVRSLRPVFFDTAMEYSTPVAHAGGSTDALDSVRTDKAFKDLDQFYNGNSFRRITSRYAPHNLYIYGPKLVELVAAKGWGTTPTFTAWPRKDDAPAATLTATKITANFSSSMYTATFAYDTASNSYIRSIGDQVDIDAGNSNQAVKPKVVIAVYAPTQAGVQPNGKPKTDIDILGSGKGTIFQDGTAVDVTWNKTSSTARMTFKDASGNEVKLNRGQTWVSILPTDRPVTY